MQEIHASFRENRPQPGQWLSGDGETKERELTRIEDHLRTTRRFRHCIETAARLLPMPDFPVVYFVSSFTLRHVKIGFAYDLSRRLASLQTGNPAPLLALAYCPGGLRDERVAHKHFEDDRGTGEWFIRSPSIDRIIRSLQRAIADQHGIDLPTANPWDAD